MNGQAGHHLYTLSATLGSAASAVRGLTRLGISHYLPVYGRRIAARGRVLTRITPLFPGYLFVRPHVSFSVVRQQCQGISSVVMDGESPAVVPECVVDELRSREINGLVHIPPVAPRFRGGEEVLSRSGLFQGHQGIVEGMDGDEMVAVLFNLLGVGTRVAVHQDDLDIVQEQRRVNRRRPHKRDA